MPNRIKYGVSNVSFEGDEDGVSNKCVKFGDGETAIFTVNWNCGIGGIKMCRTVEKIEKFSKHVYNEENKPHKEKGEQVYLLFDNTLSIDSMMHQLTILKNDMLDEQSNKKH